MAQVNAIKPSASIDLAGLAAKARHVAAVKYSGDVLSLDVYNFLHSHNGALIDVRTTPEWQLGLPNLADCRGNLNTISWKLAPDYTLNPEFQKTLQTALPNKDFPLFFMCRSGGRSLDAAAAMTAAGYRNCFNVTGGFESTEGWKASNLPWKKL
jgi:rhodanese-related sulfurtransferase